MCMQNKNILLEIKLFRVTVLCSFHYYRLSDIHLGKEDSVERTFARLSSWKCKYMMGLYLDTPSISSHSEFDLRNDR
jgi:hypothetical protein